MMMSDSEKSSKLGVLEDLIKYMRKLELAKDETEDPLSEGLEAVGDKLEDKAERGMEEEEPEVEISLEAEPSGEGEDTGETEEESEELSPFQQKMKDYFNDTDRPKVGNSMAFMVESKKPVEKVAEVEMAVKKKKRGRPFRNR